MKQVIGNLLNRFSPGKKFQVAGVFIFLSFQASIYSQDANTLAATYIQKYRNHISDAGLLSKIKQLPAEKVIDAFTPFTGDSLSSIRSIAVQQIAVAGIRCENLKTRQKTITTILKAIDDKDAGVIGNAIDQLNIFKAADFTPEQRYLISQKVKTGSPYLDKIILLTGYLNITDLIYNYQQILKDEGSFTKRNRINIQLALARMGDTTAITSLVTRMKNLKVNDNVVYDVFPLLAYTRQKVMFDFLLEVIQSDEKNCLSSNPDKEEPVLCAFRVIEMVSPYINDFPAKVDFTGELISGNYNNTLKDVKEWIQAHKSDYTLNYDIY